VIDSLGISNWTGDSKSPVQYTSPKLENVQKNNYQIFLSSCTTLRLCTDFYGSFLKKIKDRFGATYLLLITKASSIFFIIRTLQNDKTLDRSLPITDVTFGFGEYWHGQLYSSSR
jgi:hypothetical protein